MNTIKKGLYEAALYLRLSRDDVDIDGSAKTESNSIGSQRELLRDFVRSHDEIQIFDIYVDDGYTGSNFDRPEFKRMTEDINSGRVNCVIVKDLSRFGRDYIEAGRFIQKIYPALNVRFIAITDNYDSLTADKAESSLILPVKNFVNDSYCRDISQKVRAHQSIKRKNGEFIGAFAPFGYEKDRDNKNKLVIDEYAADVVKNIFVWKIEGLSLMSIANKLNNLGILSPKEYKNSKGLKYHSGFESSGKSKWHPNQIRRILTDEVYVGNMVQGKQEVISYKVKKRLDKPHEEWQRVTDTHEGIIRKNDFELVQKLMKCDGRASSTSDKSNLFSGILFCGDCKAPMIRRKNKYKGKEKVFYICSTKNKKGECSRHSMPEDELVKILWKEMRAYTNLFIDYAEISKEISKIEVNFEQVIEYDSQISELQKEYAKYYGLKTSLYDDLKEGIIDCKEFDEYMEIYDNKCCKIQNMIENQKNLIKKMVHDGAESAVELKDWKKLLALKNIDRTLLLNIVDKIWIYEDKRIQIDFRYKNELDKLVVIANFFYDHKKERSVV